MGTRITRRQFFSSALAGLAAAAVGPAIFTAGCTGSGTSPASGGGGATPNRPNILLVMTDQLRMPPIGYAAGEGEAPGIREVFGFSPTVSPDNTFAPFFPGFLRLRQNGVVLRTHYTASAACVPSRATLLTGQYPTVHGVSQTTGLFKSGDDPGFVFLDPDGIPTVGDWFQAAGYEPHYFGKWHVSEACDDLGPWGFPLEAWDGPEPHGSNPANMGAYRDPGFASDTIKFLNSKVGQQPGQAPWFAVCSFVNPHDVSGWPFPWFEGGTGVQTAVVTPDKIPSIPSPGAMSNPQAGDPPGSSCPAPASAAIPLNPDGFPTGSFGPPPTMQEDLTTKPSCHFDGSYKFGMALSCKMSLPSQLLSPYPFQIRGANEDPWTLAYGEFWTYLHYMFDIQLRRVLEALDASGLAENTIVVFTSDHGEYAGAHGHSIQKWHTAYEEGVRVPFVVSSPLVNPTEGLREVTQTTSHIDLLPTLLGLAGFSAGEVDLIRARITGQGTVPPLVGVDLSPLVRNPNPSTPILGRDGQPRPGALYMTIDEITEMVAVDPSYSEYPLYQKFLQDVEIIRNTFEPRLQLGPIVQPNNVYTLATGVWKYSRYVDPHGVEADQYEMYHLPSDPNEAVNLVDFRTNQIRPDVSVPGMTLSQLTIFKDQLAAQLTRQEQLLL